MKCCICYGDIEEHIDPKTGKVYWKEGNNAKPIESGRCCDKCDGQFVIPERIHQVMLRKRIEQLRKKNNGGK